jgi:hypothetical protein
MDSYQPTVLERSTLTFCVDGMSARDEMLFKAFVRLLDHLTHQQWRSQAAAPNQPVDLLVLAEGSKPATAPSPQSHNPPQVLWLSKEGTNLPGFLTWPLRPDALERELNRVGSVVMSQRGPKPGPALFTGAATGTPIARGAQVKLMRLQQWPPTQFLTGSGRMRLATLLTGKAMSLDELVYRSALPLPLCEAFVNDLQRAGLLVEPSTVFKPALTQVQGQGLTPRSPFEKPPPQGLFAKIRMRLGIQSS